MNLYCRQQTSYCYARTTVAPCGLKHVFLFFFQKQCLNCSTSQPICRIMGIENVLALAGLMTFEKMTPRLSSGAVYKK